MFGLLIRSESRAWRVPCSASTITSYTDDSILLDLMRTNAELNMPGSDAKNLHVAELSWGEAIRTVPAEVDVVLAADCVYFEVCRVEQDGRLESRCRDPGPPSARYGVYRCCAQDSCLGSTLEMPCADTPLQPAFPLLVQTLCDLAPIGKDMEILFCWKKRRKVSSAASEGAHVPIRAVGSRSISTDTRCSAPPHGLRPTGYCY
jgi:hypothetical protein